MDGLDRDLQVVLWWLRIREENQNQWLCVSESLFVSDGEWF